MNALSSTYSAVVGLGLCCSAAMALETKPALTLDLAKKIAAGCEAKAKQENWKMNVAVVNDGTKLVYFEHMDGAFLGSIAVSQQKAITSAEFPFPSRSWASWPSVKRESLAQYLVSPIFPAFWPFPEACP